MTKYSFFNRLLDSLFIIGATQADFMQVKNLELTNIGPFEHLDLPIAPTKDRQSNVTVIVGNNGAGKTMILNALVSSLQLFKAQMSGQTEVVVEGFFCKNGKSESEIIVQIADKKNSPETWVYTNKDLGLGLVGRKVLLGKVCQGEKVVDRSEIVWKYLLDTINNKEKKAFQPLIELYPARRTILDISFGEVEITTNTGGTEVDIVDFFKWFRQREDIENEMGMSSTAYAKISELLTNDLGDVNPEAWKELSKLQENSRDPQLNAVRYAISAFMPEYKNLHIQRKPTPQMMVTKGTETLNINQLSQGEKSFLALIGDIARRLAMMNPGLDDPLQGEGIVMIDEVDLHLHPKWQRSLIERLTNTFPNLQFVLTTHSPLVISDSKDVLVYVLDDGEVTQMDNLYGLDANQVLLEVMDTDIRNPKAEEDIADLLDHIQDGELKEAKIKLEALEQEMAQGHFELVKAKILIRKAELRHAKNH